jgi:type I restriction enzyme R subunit
VQEAIAVYSSDELDIDEGERRPEQRRPEGLAATEGRKLDEAREALRYLCEPVAHPREMEQLPALLLRRCQRSASALNDTEPLRISVLQGGSDVPCGPSAAIAQNLDDAGYSGSASCRDPSRGRVLHADTRSGHRRSTPAKSWTSSRSRPICGTCSTPTCRPTRRQTWATSSALSLTELIIKTGIHDAIAQRLNAERRLSVTRSPKGSSITSVKRSSQAQLTDPRFYARMSQPVAGPDQTKPRRRGRP